MFYNNTYTFPSGIISHTKIHVHTDFDLEGSQYKQDQVDYPGNPQARCVHKRQAGNARMMKGWHSGVILPVICRCTTFRVVKLLGADVLPFQGLQMTVNPFRFSSIKFPLSRATRLRLVVREDRICRNNVSHKDIFYQRVTKHPLLWINRFVKKINSNSVGCAQDVIYMLDCTMYSSLLKINLGI